MTYRAVTTGGRHYARSWGRRRVASAEREHLWAVLDELLVQHPDLALAQGGATGSDAATFEWARARGVPCETYHADWYPAPKRRFDASAGPRRNRFMLDDFKPHEVIAFPGQRGTENCVEEALKRRIKTTRATRAKLAVSA